MTAVTSDNHDELDRQALDRKFKAATPEERKAMVQAGYRRRLTPEAERGCGSCLAVGVALIGVVGVVLLSLDSSPSVYGLTRAGLMSLIGLASGLCFLFRRNRWGFWVLALTAIPFMLMSLNGRG
ncbi:hypothetical protein AB0B07_01735 [Streptomyces sioyaensis]